MTEKTAKLDCVLDCCGGGDLSSAQCNLVRRAVGRHRPILRTQEKW